MVQQKSLETAAQRQEQAVEDSFPASDPPANSGIVGPGGTSDKPSPQPSHERGDEARPKGTPTDDRHATETAHFRENETPPQHGH